MLRGKGDTHLCNIENRIKINAVASKITATASDKKINLTDKRKIYFNSPDDLNKNCKLFLRTSFLLTLSTKFKLTNEKNRIEIGPVLNYLREENCIHA